jgi:protoheme IX farnesyltransferase
MLGTVAVGIYLLVVAGATAAFADAAGSCGGWPLCEASLADPGVLVAMGHRVVAAVVGLLVVLTAVTVWRSTADARVKTLVGLALVLYPGQILVGARVAASGGAGSLPGVHLALGMTIFGALVLALAWHLETTTGGADDPVDLADSPEPAVDALDGTDAGSTPAAPSTAGPRTAEPTSAEPTGAEPTTAESTGGEDTAAAAPGLRTRLGAYARLTKPRLMWLLCLVAAAGMALAAGPALTVRTVVLTLSGGVLAIGASGTFNHVLERDRDQRMARTADRPVATHQVPVRRATAFGVALAALSLAVFWQLNALAAALGLAAILFYSVVYTLVLKPNTVQNTVIGGAAGALPAVIGAAAATGKIGLPGLALAGLIFVWTPAHFYNLALAYKEDYARGGFPMMPVVRGETTTRKHILLWLGTTMAAATALLWVTDLGWLAAGAAVVLGVLFLWAVVRLHREQTERAAFRAFHASNAYLGVVLVAVVVDALAV